MKLKLIWKINEDRFSKQLIILILILAFSFLNKLLTKDTKNRATISQALNHEFILQTDQTENISCEIDEDHIVLEFMEKLY